MNSGTKELFEMLESADLFRAVGRKDVEDWAYATSWMDAVAHCVGSSWSDAAIEGLNTLSRLVLERSKGRYGDWHGVDSEVRPLAAELARKKTADLLRANGLPDKVMFSMFADVLGMGMESEYADLVEPGFFTNVVLTAYRQGHFPCGWKGEYPQGKLVVY